MRRSVAAVLMVAGFGQVAVAADMPAKAPVLKAPVATTNWTGFYLTGGAGYGLWAADTTTTTPAGAPALFVPQTQGGKGFLGRIGGGYDYQLTSKIVVGVFGDYDFSNLKGTLQDQGPFLVGDIKQTSAWAFGARVGWLTTPRLLSFTSAGYTGARFSGATLTPQVAGFATGVTPGFTRNGWFLGGGMEVAVTSGWFWRNEYRYAYYGTQTINDTNIATGAALSNITFKPTVQTVTTQVVYKFNPPGAPTPVHQAVPEIAANWTGFYVNAGGGYGMWAADTTTVSPVTGACVLCATQTQGGKGWLGTVGGGYDYRFTPNIVGGVFADFNYSNLKGTIQDQGPFFAGEIKQTSAWAVGARAGWLVTPSALTYVNGGYTNARFSGATMLGTGTGAVSGSTTQPFTRGGWFLGGGMEAPVFMTGFFWRNEYRYASYSRATTTDCPAAGVCLNNNITFKPAVQTVTTQLIYKFGGGPVFKN
ncbi:MAG: outer membrane beta-barrel protein [Pseudomonadota bacterium]